MAEAPSKSFRKFLPDLSTPRFARLAECDAYSHALELIEHQRPPWLYGLYQHWMRLLEEPFRGVTSDGIVHPSLFQLRDEGVPIESIVSATRKVLDQLNPGQQAKMIFHIDSPQWRTWSNPEFLLSDKGIRLDELSEGLRGDVMAVLAATLSSEGYEKAVSAMRINGFLGELMKAPKVMNEFSYNFCVFGNPSVYRPWGWSFYGHHLCLSVFLYGPQIVISPWFTGAEPDQIDEGPHKGIRIFQEEERIGLQLFRSLSADERAKVTISAEMKSDEMIEEGRWNHDDQRHLCGAYRDNRVVPYEGILVSALSSRQQEDVTAILAQYLTYLPTRSRELKLQDCKSFFDETYFSWMGGSGDQDPFYFRIQSPVVLVEFDHHSGVFLTNSHPEKFHIHTLLRTPNGGDYGYALRSLRREGGQGNVPQSYLWRG